MSALQVTISALKNCLNTDGNYTCSCNSTYTLNSNGYDCDGMNNNVPYYNNSNLQHIIQTSTNAFQAPPMPASRSVSTLQDHMFVSVMMDSVSVMTQLAAQVHIIL